MLPLLPEEMVDFKSVTCKPLGKLRDLFLMPGSTLKLTETFLKT